MRLDGEATLVVPVLAQVAADAGDDASRQLSMVIIALVVLAVIIAVATVVFWRLTRPEAPGRPDAVRWVPETAITPATPAAPPSAPVIESTPTPAVDPGAVGRPAPAVGDTGTPPGAR